MAPGASRGRSMWSTGLSINVNIMGRKKKVEVGAFIECHKTCAFSRGNTCKIWSTSHRELYKEIENEHDYEFFMANAWNNRGGKYKDALMCLLIERSQTFRKIPLYAVNQDIDKIMRRLV